MNVVGIDPGLAGALAIISPQSILLDVVDMPTVAVSKTKSRVDHVESLSLLEQWRDTFGDFRIVMEKVSVRGGQKGVIQVVRNAIVFEGLAIGMRWRFEDVAPIKWQGAMISKKAAERTKGAARLRAQALWPEAYLGNRKDEGRSEAALIALYGLREM